MAAWLAYLKSRLLLPETGTEEEPSGAEMAAALKFQMQRLQAMRDAGGKLIMLPQLGNDIFARGTPERPRTRTTTTYRSEEHTSELQSLMRISYAVFCMKKQTTQKI